MTQALDMLAEITGWLSVNEANWLNHMARQTHDGVIVEIGSFQGKSAIALALGAAHGVPVYTIDPHHAHTDEIGATFGPQDRAALYRNITAADLGETICVVNLTSDHAVQGWREPIGLLFVDGAHNFEQVKRDVLSWLPHVLEHGLIAIHDRTWPDIQRLISLLSEHEGVRQYAMCDSIIAYRKVADG